MFFLSGTIVNVLAILVGGALGLLVGKRFGERYRKVAMQAMGLVVIVIGLRMVWPTENVLLLIVSMVLGAFLGEWIRVEDRLGSWGASLKRRAKSETSTFVEGFVTASLLFCVGSMAILGSIEDGLHSDSSILFAKSLLDGITSVAFAAALGAGVLLSSLPVLLYQGGITVMAWAFGSLVSDSIISAISGTGGLLILALGLNMVGMPRIRVGNLLPAILVAALLAWVF